MSRGLFSVRTGVKLVDYLGYSLPLIILAFIAAGFAISMLFADVLNRTNIKDQILDVMDEEIEKNKQDNPMLAAILPMLKAKVSAVRARKRLLVCFFCAAVSFLRCCLVTLSRLCFHSLFFLTNVFLMESSC